MELLAPAGSIEQAISSVKSGCDAIYGGLNEWNARNRAKNFTVDQYKYMLHYCHENNVLFYLTVNALFHDKEIDSVITLFQSDGFELPDAVIVADVGLMSVLHEYFPKLDIHASTQFGAYNIEDVKILLELGGVKRVVLARELFLSEIEAIRALTSMELEVFVFGSQCVCFSGQCLWGGLINKNSGNRGRCIGMCRDFYRKENNIGQFLYPRDINAIGLINKMKEIGIDGVKIEGRLRLPEVTSKIVTEVRKALSYGSDPNNENYYGYLGGPSHVVNMFSAVHDRTKTIKVIKNTEIKIEKEDLFYELIGDSYYVHQGYLEDFDSSNYIGSYFPNCMHMNQNANAIRLHFSDNVLVNITLIDSNGCKRRFEINGDYTEKIQLRKLYKEISSIIKFDIYEFYVDNPVGEFVFYNKTSMNQVIELINNYYENHQTGSLSKIQLSLPCLFDSIVVTDKIEDIVSIAKYGTKVFVFCFGNTDVLTQALELEKKGINIIYKLPILDFNQTVNEWGYLLSGKCVMIRRMSHLLSAKKYGWKPTYADYNLNIWNSKTASVLKKYGVSTIVANPELSFEDNMDISQKSNLSMLFIAFGRLPLGYTRACLGKAGLCERKCDNGSFILVNEYKKYGVEISCNAYYGYRSIIRAGYEISGVPLISDIAVFDLCNVPTEDKEKLMLGVNDLIENEINIIYEKSVV